VSNVAFSPNGQLLASAGEGGPQGGWLKVWDTNTWKELLCFINAGPPVAFSPDGRYLAAAERRVGTDFLIKIRDAATGLEVHTLKGHSGSITAVVFSPETGCPRLASASWDSSVRIWDVTTGRESRTLPGRAGDVQCAAFSPDGHLLAAGGMGRVIKIWDAGTWELMHEQPDLTGCVHSVAFDPKDSRILAWGSTDATVKVWNTATKQMIRTLHGHSGSVESVAFSPDGEWIASASRDGTVKIWQVPFVPEGRPSGGRSPRSSPGGAKMICQGCEPSVNPSTQS